MVFHGHYKEDLDDTGRLSEMGTLTEEGPSPQYRLRPANGEL